MSRLRSTDDLTRLLGIPFSEEQREAITAAPDAPGVIIAGAGSGKTTVMAARVVWLVGHHGLDPGSILGLTFTAKAAVGLASKIRHALGELDRDFVRDPGDEPGEPTVSTYHAFASQLVSEHGLRLGFESDLRLVSDASQFQRAASAIRRFPGPLELVTSHLPTLVADVVSFDSTLNDHLITPSEVRAENSRIIAEAEKADRMTGGVKKGIEAARKRDELVALVEAYRTMKDLDGVCDFSDLMARGAHVALGSPEVQRIMRERFPAVLLDEYQDTSYGQRVMLQSLFSGATPAEGRGHPVTAVGDPAQGIYGWRGAAGDSLTGFTGHFPRADGSPSSAFSLVTCRRCDADILDLANTVAAEFYESSDVVQPLRPAPQVQPGTVSVARYPTVDTEVAALADAVADRGAKGGTSWSDIAVLVRTWGEVEHLTTALRSRGVPAEVLGLTGLLVQPEVSDVLALLEIVDDACANTAMMRLLGGARWRIGTRDLALLGQRATRLAREGTGGASVADDPVEAKLLEAVAGADPVTVASLSDAVADPGPAEYSDRARARFAELAEVIRGARRRGGDAVSDQVHHAVNALGLDIELAATDVGAQGRENLAILAQTAADFERNADTASLSGFLAYLRAEEEHNKAMTIESPSDTDSVKVLTIHKAKGLEWPVVYVPFLADGFFPSGQRRARWTSAASAIPTALRGDAEVLPTLSEWSEAGLKAFAQACSAEDLAEELRLAYVAFTRAAHELHLSGHWWGRTQLKPRGASPYLDKAHEWALSAGHRVGEWTEAPAEGESNPHDIEEIVPWPAPAPALAARREAAIAVRRYLDDPKTAAPDPEGTDAEANELAFLEQVDTEITRLRAEVESRRSDVIEVPLPERLSPTALIAWRSDPQGFARRLYRPMPTRPVPGARLGTRFHAWVEQWFDRRSLFEPEEVVARHSEDVPDDDSELDALIAGFMAGPYAHRTPEAIEPAFQLVIGGQPFTGRIDAVFTTGDGYEIVDWKTNRDSTSDPLQLAIYRLAWAERVGVDPERITASFYYVARDEVVTYDGTDLPGRDDIEHLLAST